MKRGSLLVMFGGILSLMAFAVSPLLQLGTKPEQFSVSAQTVGPTGITVITDGVISAQPDVAYVTVGVQTTAPTAQEAASKNTATMNNVLAAIAALGISPSDMRTSGISLYPVSSSPTEIAGYNASNNLTITVNKISQASTVLDTAIQAGANSASSINFAIKDDTALRTQALTEAIKASRPKADAVATALGLTIKGIANVSEDISGSNVTTPGAGGAAGGAGTPVLPGQLNVTARVAITYSY